MLQSGAYGCVFEKLNCDGRLSQSRKKRKSHITKVQEYNSIAVNEGRIGELVCTIPNYELHFVPVEKMCSVKVKPNLRHLRQCEPANQTVGNERYALMTMPYKRGEDLLQYMMSHSASRRERLALMFDMYRMLLNSVELLAEHRIVHMDLHGNNVRFSLDTNTPLVLDFGMSIAIDEVNDSDCTQFGPDVEWWCLDVHVLSLLRENDRALYDFFDDCVPPRHILRSVLMPNEMEAYQAAGSARIEEYMRLTREESEERLWSGWRTWDNYSVSILMLYMLNHFFGARCRENPILEEFVQLLVTNLDPDPTKRLSTAETKRRFDQLFYTVEEPQVYLDLLNVFRGGA